MKAISTGNQFVIYDDSLKTYDQLPAQTYRVEFSKHQGFFLEKHIEPDPRENKIYGNHSIRVEKVMNAFKRADRNLGVILSGDKGIGKTLFAKLLSLKAIENNLPLLVVDRFIPGIAAYLQSITQECIVLFDEFDKTFYNTENEHDGTTPQTEMLTLFDGITPGKKLFIVTCNDIYRLSDYLINRPGRFHYHFRFEYPDEEQVRTYLQDKLPTEQWKEIDDVVEFAARVPLNYDCLRAIAFELCGGATFKDACKELNIINKYEVTYNVTCVFNNGTTLSGEQDLDLYNGKKQHCYLFLGDEGRIKVTFDASVMTFNHKSMATIIDGKGAMATVDWHANANVENEMKQIVSSGVARLEIRKAQQEQIHYAV